jgi:nucleotide-binding universal stress UspA family protein
MDAPAFGSSLLVPFDGSTNAEVVFPYVPLLADGQRQIILLQVVPEARELRSALGDVAISAEELQAASESAARATLERAADRLNELDPELIVEEVVVAGDPSEQIANVAAARHVGGIVLASQGVSAVGPGGFGSVVSRVVRTAPAPVLVVRTNRECATPDIGRFVIAHDGSDRANRAMPVAHQLAKRLGAHIHVVAVVRDERSPLADTTAMSLDPHILEMFHGDARRAAQHHVESVVAGLLRQGQPASWQVLTGPAAPAIIDALAPSDVLVLTPHGRTGSRWMIGSIAEKLVRECPVPVLLVRSPDDRPGVGQ